MYILTEKLTSSLIMYMIFRRIMRDWKKWDAFKYGIIDDKGKRLKKPKTAKERDSFDILDRFCWSIKRLCTKYMGDSTFAYIFSAAYLMKEQATIIFNSDKKYLTELENITIEQQKILFDCIQELEHNYLLNESHLDLETNLLKIATKAKTIVEQYNLTFLNESDNITTNSLGLPISDTEEGITNFWKWFGDSKVVDEQGRPLVYYHGTKSKEKFNTFDTSIPHRPRTQPEGGIFFTSDYRAANNYGRVKAVYLKIESPLNTTNDINKNLKKKMNFGDAKREALSKYSEQNDGVIFNGNKMNTDEYVVFNNNQIKSIDNNGNFGNSNIITEDEAVSPVATTETSLGDVAQFTPRLGSIIRRRFKLKRKKPVEVTNL